MRVDDPRERALQLFQEGTRLSESGRLAEGSRLLERAIETDPTFVPAYCNRALNHVRDGELDRAAELFESARDLAPEDPGPWAGLGAVEAERGRDEAAIRALSQAIELGHPGAEVRSNLALVLDRWGDRERALSLWRQAHEIDRGDPNPVAALGERLDLTKDAEGRPFALGRFQRYDLYRHLDERFFGPDGPRRCPHDFRESAGWALSRGIAPLPFLHHLRRWGAVCDCEVSLAFAEGQDGAFEFARAETSIRTGQLAEVARALAAAGATEVSEFLPPTLSDHDDPESWATQFLRDGGCLVFPPQPAVGSRLFRLLDAARIGLGPAGWATVVLRSTTDLVAPALWYLEERRALELAVRLHGVEDETGFELDPAELPPMEPSTFHIQSLAAPWLPPGILVELTRAHGLHRSVSTLGDWTLAGGRVDDEEPAVIAFLADLAALAPPEGRLSLRWTNRGRLRAGWVESGRLRVCRLVAEVEERRDVPPAAIEFARTRLEG